MKQHLATKNLKRNCAFKITFDTTCSGGCWEPRLLIYCWWGYKMVWEIVWQFHIKLNLLLPYATQKLHYWVFIPEGWKLTFTQKLYRNVHSSFILNSPNWKQSKCQPVSEETNCGIPTLSNTMQQQKGLLCWKMQKHSWLSNELCCMKTAITKRYIL